MPALESLVGVWDGTHLTKMRVLRLNRVTFDCMEVERSHSPGRLWRVRRTHEYAVWGTLPDGRATSRWINSRLDS